MRSFLSGTLVFFLSSVPCFSGLAASLEEAFWPQFRGIHRDGISRETGLLQAWPPEGPPLLWSFDACGIGYAGVSIAEGKIFTAGDFQNEERILALDMKGHLLWQAVHGRAWRGSTPGSRATPTYKDGWLFHMNPTGLLSAFQAQDGQKIWSVDLSERFGARYGTWALAENVLVEDQMVFCLPGGKEAFAVALDKRSGEPIWVNKDVDERAAYCSPCLVTHQGVRLLITLSHRSVVCLDADTGQLLWSHPFGRVWQNTTIPVFHEGHVFVTCGHSSGGLLLKIHQDLKGVDRVWFREDFDNCHGGVILLDRVLVGSGCRLGGKAFFGVDFHTGQTRFSTKDLDKVSILYADERLYCLDNQRKVSLVSLREDGLDIVSQFELPKTSKEESLCHPVVCGKRLYLRHDETLFVYDIEDPSR